MNKQPESDDSKMWADYKKERQIKRWSNDEWSRCLLKKRGVKIQVMNKAISHYRIGDWDFWATTGKYINRRTGQTGRGVKNLLILLEREK